MGTLTVTVDCTDPERLTEFWAALLGYERQGGVAQYASIRPADGGIRGPKLVFQAVPEPKAGKNRLHLGLAVAARVDSARPHDSKTGRTLLDDSLPALPRVEEVLADLGFEPLVKGVHRRHRARHRQGSPASATCSPSSDPLRLPNGQTVQPGHGVR